MGSDLFGASVSALNSAQIGMATTEHNIANASTPGYTRQEAVVSARAAQHSGAGYIGQGSDVSTIKRIYDNTLSNLLTQQQGQAASLNSYYAQIQQINNMVADPNAGLAPALQDFFNSVNGVASSPESMPARQTMLSNAQSLSSRFQSLNKQLADLNGGVNSQIYTSTQTINGYAKQIATLNNSIVLAQASNPNQPPNDLLDQRDHAIAQLNKELNVSVINQGDGSYNVTVGNGQLLVSGGQAFSLQPITSPNDPTKLDVAYNAGGGVVMPLPQSNITGGNLGGLLAFRSQSLDATQNSLGLVAMGLAGTFNQQHQLGQDLNGALGGNFFTQPAAPVVNPDTSNTGAAVVSASVSNYAALTGSDYLLAYDGTNYSLTRLSDNTTTTYATLPQTVDGLTITTSATPAANDRFMIRPTVNGAISIAVAISDPAKIAAAAPIRTNAPLTNAGDGKISMGSVELPPLGTALDPNLTNPVTVTFTDPTHYTVTTVPAAPTDVVGVVYDPLVGATLSFNGWTAQLTGAPKTGDTFTVNPNIGGSSDNRNVLSLVGLQTKSTLLGTAATVAQAAAQKTLAGGTTSYLGVYGLLVSQIGNKTRELDVTSTAQNSLVASTTQAQQSVSGVNLDEEAANLLRYQRAYQAAGKAMQIASTMFDILLSLGK